MEGASRLWATTHMGASSACIGRMNPAGNLLVWLQLAVDPTSPERVRSAIDGLGHLFARPMDATIAANELVTNAIRHSQLGSGDIIDFRVVHCEDRFRVEVSDGGTRFEWPAVNPMPEGEDSGYGLSMVEALTERWGVEATNSRGKTVWAEIEASPDGILRQSGALASLQYLADASEVLASSLDVDRTLRRLARLVVPMHADWCTINLVEEDGTIRRVAAEHEDPAKAAELARLLHAHPNEPDTESGVGYTIRTGKAQLFPEVDEALLAETANDPEYLEITRQLKIRSCVIAPLEARGRVLGAISLVYTEQDKTYDDAALALAQDLGRRAGIAIDNARLYEQRDEIAMTLQRSLLPPFLPTIPDLELSALYEPAGSGNEVGGDFYDVYEAGPGIWNLVVGDVEGKGPAAAALIGLARHTLRAIAVDRPSPADALSVLNQVMLSGSADKCCTVALCRIDVAERRVTVARAGHLAPLMLRGFGAVEPLGVPGTLLGASDSPDIVDDTIEISPGDSLILFTDGVEGRRTSSSESLEALLAELPGKSAHDIAGEMAAAAKRSQPGELGDDVAILVARSIGLEG